MKANGANMPRCLQRGALFDYRLKSLNELYLFYALSKTVAQLDLQIIDKQLHDGRDPKIG